MTLEGWINPLPAWVCAAIADGIITIHQAKGYQYLLGTAINPEGTIISFL